MAGRKLSPIHPGEVLDEEFLAPLGISQYLLAKDTNVPPRRINEIVRGTRSMMLIPLCDWRDILALPIVFG